MITKQVTVFNPLSYIVFLSLWLSNLNYYKQIRQLQYTITNKQEYKFLVFNSSCMCQLLKN